MSKVMEGCKSYMAATIPSHAGEVQKEETERAFMAGCLVMIGLVSGAETVDEMDALFEEANAYALKMIAKTSDGPKIILS